MMARLKSLYWLTLAAFALACVSQAMARTASEAEKAALVKTVDEFNAAMKAADYEKVISHSLPDPMLNFLAGKANIAPHALRQQMVALTSQVMASAPIESYGMDLAAAQHRELGNGTPYVLIPTKTVVKINDKQSAASSSHTLALMDGGRWYLIRISELQQLLILQEVYPDFNGVQFPQDAMEIIKK
jgi:hypothetical protein